jgi:hypothetical protein
LLGVASGSGGPALFAVAVTGCWIVGVDIHEAGVNAANVVSPASRMWRGDPEAPRVPTPGLALQPCRSGHLPPPQDDPLHPGIRPFGPARPGANETEPLELDRARANCHGRSRAWARSRLRSCLTMGLVFRCSAHAAVHLNRSGAGSLAAGDRCLCVSGE